MKFRVARLSSVAVCLTAIAVFNLACEVNPLPSANAPAAVNSNVAGGNANAVAVASPAASVAPSPSPVASETADADLPVTLPVLSSMFADEKFAGQVKSKLSINDEQIEKLRALASAGTANLGASDDSSTVDSTAAASQEIETLLGADKSKQLFTLVRERWEKGGDDETTGDGATTNAFTKTTITADNPNGVPKDTRVVVNAPAYRMDLFKDGKLVRSYKIGIGYPEFPLPTATRKATTLIFNPTWTPPNEPWVKGKIKAGEKVPAGSPLNPLGPIKIPIGSPSLIHGGKALGKLGGFASHGCVGLTNPQVQDFTFSLAQISGTPVTDADISNYEKAKTETKNVQLKSAMPIELRYETIVVQDGKLMIYRDVYERNTNTEANLKKVLSANGVEFDTLPDAEKKKMLDSLKQMATNAAGKPVNAQMAAENSKKEKNSSQTATKVIKGKKEIAIPVAALKGKGYPAPVDLNVGTRSKKPLSL